MLVDRREAGLSTEDKIYVENKLNNSRKNSVVMWLLWLLLGRWGFHRFYMNKAYGVGLILLNILGWILTFSIIFAFIGLPMLIASWIWWFIDGFYLNGWLQIDNNIRRNDIINQISDQNLTIHQLMTQFHSPISINPNYQRKSNNNVKSQKHNVNNNSKPTHSAHNKPPFKKVSDK